jgi:hypothetical protein
VPLGSRASQLADLLIFTGRPAWCHLVPEPLSLQIYQYLQDAWPGAAWFQRFSACRSPNTYSHCARPGAAWFQSVSACRSLSIYRTPGLVPLGSKASQVCFGMDLKSHFGRKLLSPPTEQWGAKPSFLPKSEICRPRQGPVEASIVKGFCADGFVMFCTPVAIRMVVVYENPASLDLES